MGNACSDSVAVDSGGGISCCGPPEVTRLKFQWEVHSYTGQSLGISNYASQNINYFDILTYISECALTFCVWLTVWLYCARVDSCSQRLVKFGVGISFARDATVTSRNLYTWSQDSMIFQQHVSAMPHCLCVRIQKICSDTFLDALYWHLYGYLYDWLSVLPGPWQGTLRVMR